MQRFNIPLIFLLVGGLYILLSDALVSALVSDPNVLTHIQTYKGWGFVIATAILLEILIRRQQAQVRQQELAKRQFLLGTIQGMNHVLRNFLGKVSLLRSTNHPDADALFEQSVREATDEIERMSNLERLDQESLDRNLRHLSGAHKLLSVDEPQPLVQPKPRIT